MTNPPEGAEEAVAELITSFALTVDRWEKNAADKSPDFRRTAVLIALTNSLVTAAMGYGFPPEVVMKSVIVTLDATGAFDDDETVH